MKATRASPQHASNAFDGVKVFSATMLAERSSLGEKVTAWIAAHPAYEIIDIVQTQSSDEAFHCIALSLFYRRGRS